MGETRGWLKKAVVEGMMSHPTQVDFTITELADDLGLSVGRVGTTLRRMATQGECRVMGNKHSRYKKFSLTKYGENKARRLSSVPVTKAQVAEEVEPEVVHESLPTPDEIVEGFINKLMEYEARALEDAESIQQLTQKNAELEKQIREIQLSINQRRSLARRLADRIT